MLVEWLMQVLTPASRAVRRMDLVRASVGLWSRGGRQSSQWQTHYDRCHAVVRRAIAGVRQRRTVVVLGSGLVRDVPLRDLLDGFETVVLVDAVHLPTVRLRMAREPRVRLVSADLSGLSDWIEGRASGRTPLDLGRLAGADVDLVISANLLSQMPLGIDAFLGSRAARRGHWPADLPRRVVEGHLADLRAMGPRICLLTDVTMEERDRSGNVTDRLDLMRGAVLPPPDERWTWTVAPFGEIERGREYVHHVHGYADFTGLAAEAEAVTARPSPPSPDP